MAGAEQKMWKMQQGTAPESGGDEDVHQLRRLV